MSHCHSHHHHGRHCCHESESCGHECHEHNVCSCCGHSEGTCEEKDFAAELLCIADEAWMELLKEKIKKHIQSNCDSQLEEIAKVVSEGNKMRWEHKMGIKKAKQEFRDKLAQAFGCSTGSCKTR